MGTVVEQSDTIVLSRPDRLGDVVIATSTIRPLLEQRPGTRVVFAARRIWLPLLRGHPLLADCIDVSEPEDVLTVRLRELAPSALVHLNPHAGLYRAGHAARIPVRVGYARDDLPDALTHSLPDQRRNGGRHEAQFNFDLLGQFGIEPPCRPVPELHLPEPSLRSLETKLGRPLDDMEPFVVLHPSAYLTTARWPPHHFHALARLIGENTAWRIVITGDDPRDRGVHKLAGWLGESAVNLAGQTDVAELGWLFSRAAGVVTRDTGPSHVAGAVGAPTVSICGRTAPVYSPVRWGALGPRVELVVRSLPRRRFERKEWNWRRSFAAITPEEVFEALLRVSALP